MEELLVTIACLSGKGCPETVHLYYTYNPKVEAAIKQSTAKATAYIGQDVARLAPIAFIAAGGSGSVRINRYISLDISKGEGIVSFKYDF